MGRNQTFLLVCLRKLALTRAVFGQKRVRAGLAVVGSVYNLYPPKF